jgi:hypothetical protein
MIKNIVFLCLFFNGIMHCADQKEIKDTSSDMQKVKEWIDVVSFVNAIVIYRATDRTITQGDSGYSIDTTNPMLRAGFVKGGFARRMEAGDEGYEMSCLLKKGCKSKSCCTLVDSAIAKNEGKCIGMRKATAAEIATIKAAISSKKAEFDHQDHIDENLQKIFTSQS